jgi:hypothetical protein
VKRNQVLAVPVISTISHLIKFIYKSAFLLLMAYLSEIDLVHTDWVLYFDSVLYIIVCCKAVVVLDTVATAFSSYCKEAFSVETIEVTWPDGSVHRTPHFQYRKEVVNVKQLNSYIGIKYGHLYTKHYFIILPVSFYSSICYYLTNYIESVKC